MTQFFAQFAGNQAAAVGAGARPQPEAVYEWFRRMSPKEFVGTTDPMGDSSVVDFVIKFERGCYFVPLIASDAQAKLRQFMNGLRLILRRDVMNPAKPSGAGCRGVISVLPSKPFFNGVINAGGIDFLSGCLLPMHVSMDTRPCVRSISWSPAGTPLKIKECNVQLITEQQYASRNAMLTPLIVAWSPFLRKSEDWDSIPHNSSGCCSILATGLKCGLISFWRIDAPESYSIITPELPCKATNGGFLKAYDTCITSICWALYGSEISKPQLLLATGSSNGRVKIWKVITVDSATVSILSFTAPLQTPLNFFLAIGKGSRSFEVCTMNMTSHEFEIIGCYSAHDHIVIGLAWAFDGLCLYSCSQDNSMKAWNLVGKALREIHIPSNTPGLNSSPDVPYVYDSCFGLAVSHGSLAIVVARRFDFDLLNPMYQEITQKAAIEFFWIGGQQLDTSSNICFDIDFGSFPGFPELHLINVIIRHVVLKNDEVSESRKHQYLERFSSAIEEQTNVWKELQLCCENELRRRLVGLYFSAILDLLSDVPTNFCDVGCWRPDEWPQLEHYISLHEKIVEDDFKFLAAKVGKIKKWRESFEYEEHCSFCSAIVPFESIEYAICSGVKNGNGVDQTHKLHRCSVSMQLCPAKYSCLQEIFLTMLHVVPYVGYFYKDYSLNIYSPHLQYNEIPI
ncbi:uncharacterized protein [Primulina eburnea]|uniref:uncharacterized protein n=1 Tax=Primulina eburnea TaxID=1245227 RepID=UPI003C6C442B